ncbi:hypothetical protein ABZ922_08380 [Streptomyces shenzhenensis]|uniref:hypothetical protein n=1 Tax=Streptomyces shenzhenensis TaxID=943815 RepID=UPI0033DE1CFE
MERESAWLVGKLQEMPDAQRELRRGPAADDAAAAARQFVVIHEARARYWWDRSLVRPAPPDTVGE